MEVRIDLISDGPETIVRVAGHLSGTRAAQLKKTCDPIADPFAIDLSDLLFADDEGISVIRNLVAERGVQLNGVSPFVQLLLNNVPGYKNGGRGSRPS